MKKFFWSLKKGTGIKKKIFFLQQIKHKIPVFNIREYWYWYQQYQYSLIPVPYRVWSILCLIFCLKTKIFFLDTSTLGHYYWYRYRFSLVCVQVFYFFLFFLCEKWIINSSNFLFSGTVPFYYQTWTAATKKNFVNLTTIPVPVPVLIQIPIPVTEISIKFCYRFQYC